jgi:hypothetical protein
MSFIAKGWKPPHSQCKPLSSIYQVPGTTLDYRRKTARWKLRLGWGKAERKELGRPREVGGGRRAGADCG